MESDSQSQLSLSKIVPLIGELKGASGLKQPQCEYCKRYGCDLRGCASCKNVFYCGRECQQNHWQTHKEVCKKSKKSYDTLKSIVNNAKPTPGDPEKFGMALAFFAQQNDWVQCDKLLQYAHIDVSPVFKTQERALYFSHHIVSDKGAKFILECVKHLPLTEDPLTKKINNKVLIQCLCELGCVDALDYIITNVEPAYRIYHRNDPEGFGIALLFYAQRHDWAKCRLLLKKHHVNLNWCYLADDQERRYAYDHFRIAKQEELINLANSKLDPARIHAFEQRMFDQLATEGTTRLYVNVSPVPFAYYSDVPCEIGGEECGFMYEYVVFLDLLKRTPKKNINKDKIANFDDIKKRFEKLMTERHTTHFQIAVNLICYTLVLVSCLKKGFFEGESQFTLRNIYGDHPALSLLDNLFRSTLANLFFRLRNINCDYPLESYLNNLFGFTAGLSKNAPAELSRWHIRTLCTHGEHIQKYAFAPKKKPDGKLKKKPDGKLSFYPADQRSYSGYRYRDHLELTLGSEQGFNPLDIFQLIKNSACGYPACKGNNVCHSYKDAHTTLLRNSSFRLNMAKHSPHPVKPTADLEPELQKHLVSLKLFAPESPFIQMQNYICKMDTIVRRLSINGGSILGDYKPITNPERFPLPLFINHFGQVLGFFFHGTEEPNIAGIGNSSFLVSRSSAQMYGPGTYFAIQACKAAQYTESENPCLLLSAIQISHPYFVRSKDGIPETDSKLYDMVMAISGYSDGGGQSHHEIVATDRTPHIPILKIQLCRTVSAIHRRAEEQDRCVTM